MIDIKKELRFLTTIHARMNSSSKREHFEHPSLYFYQEGKKKI